MLSYAEQIKRRGYDKLPEIKRPNDELINIASLSKPLLQEEIKVKPMSKKDVLNNSREFLLKYFDIYPVPFEKTIRFLTFSFEATGYIHPFALPIKRVDDTDIFYGCSHEVLSFRTGSKACSSLRYRWIELSKELTELSPLAYTHEITHTQLNHIPGSIQDYNNVELLSIFLELVEAFENSNPSLMRAHDFFRLRELHEIINELDNYYATEDNKTRDVLLEGTSYLHGTLKAYHLFDIYMTGDIDTRRTIMIGIQRIFSHHMSVEELLNYFNINYENSINEEIFQKHIRRF